MWKRLYVKKNIWEILVSQNNSQKLHQLFYTILIDALIYHVYNIKEDEL